MKPSTIDILGGGPAGLYTAILIRKHLPYARVRVTEQNPVGATFGFGVVFSDQALDFLRIDDYDTYELIIPEMECWENMTLNLPGGQVTLDGIGYTAIGRLELIEILRARAEDAGVEMRFGHPVASVSDLKGDLIVGADGLNSLVRNTDPDAFKPKLEHFGNHFAWFGTPRAFDTLSQSFIQTDRGAFNAHHYRYAPQMSTFIVECTDDAFCQWGFAEMDEERSAQVCGEIFAEILEGAPLITNRSVWRQFPRLWCGNWISGNKAILGDAAHTAHFSIGSGTRLAMEDAIALVRSLAKYGDVQESLDHYQETRPPVAEKIVNAANTSAAWYEMFDRHMTLEPLEFAFQYITRSGRIDLERLRRITPRFMAQYEAAHNVRSG